jgi:hypothetical protein
MSELPSTEARLNRSARRHFRRGARLNRAIAVLTWTLGSAVLLFEAWVIAVGHANPYNLLNTALAVFGCALGGVLALSGDGDVILFTGLDEGQRAAITRAAACAFSLAFWGLFTLWLSWQFQPAWRATADLQIGVLLLLILLTYLVGYLWQRRRA